MYTKGPREILGAKGTKLESTENNSAIDVIDVVSEDRQEASKLQNTNGNLSQPMLVRRARKQFTESFNSYQNILHICGKISRDTISSEEEINALECDTDELEKEFQEKRNAKELSRQKEQDLIRKQQEEYDLKKRQEEAEQQAEMDRMVLDHMRYQLVQEFMAVTKCTEIKSYEVLNEVEWDINRGIVRLQEMAQALAAQMKQSQLIQRQNMTSSQQRMQQTTNNLQKSQTLGHSRNGDGSNQNFKSKAIVSAFSAIPSQKSNINQVSQQTISNQQEQQQLFQKSRTDQAEQYRSNRMQESQAQQNGGKFAGGLANLGMNNNQIQYVQQQQQQQQQQQRPSTTGQLKSHSPAPAQKKQQASKVSSQAQGFAQNQSKNLQQSKVISSKSNNLGQPLEQQQRNVSPKSSTIAAATHSNAGFSHTSTNQAANEQDKRRELILAAAEKRAEETKYRGVTKQSLAELERRQSLKEKSLSRDRGQK